SAYRSLLVIPAGYWLLVTGYWLLVTGYWLLVTGYWILKRFLETNQNTLPLMLKLRILCIYITRNIIALIDFSLSFHHRLSASEIKALFLRCDFSTHCHFSIFNIN